MNEFFEKFTSWASRQVMVAQQLSASKIKTFHLNFTLTWLACDNEFYTFSYINVKVVEN